ncbi:NADPH:quinone reductase [Rothia sp. LK2588]|uniref:NADPH:quinone reductase n=1 Tax=Rothia sp. LK2588 TaxID=3114369 RepID=UPI0034CE35ED
MNQNQLPETMKAAFVRELGPASNIEIGDLPLPQPGPDETLVKVLATTANPVDTFVRSGAFETETPFPFVIARDLVGEEVGTGRLVWSNSMGHHGRQGAASEYVAVPNDRLYPLPEGVDPLRFIAAVHPAATAYLALFEHGGLQLHADGDARGDQRVLIEGGGGNVGSMLVALASMATPHVVATASAQDLDRVRELGAETALDYHSENLGEELARTAPSGFDVQVDTSSRNDLESAVERIALGGRIVVMSGMGATPVLPVGKLYTRDGSINGFVISNATVDQLARAAEKVNELAGRGELPELKMTTRPLEQIADVHQDLEEGALRGQRVVLTF